MSDEGRPSTWAEREPKGGNMGQCDWGHEAEDVRRFPLAGNAGVFLCKKHYDREIGAWTEEDGTPPAWADLEPQIEDVGELTPHEEDRAEAAVDQATVEAEIATEAASEAIETATEVEEVIGKVEDAIPESTEPDVRSAVLDSLESVADWAEDKAAVAVEAGAEAEAHAEAAEVAEAAGDVEEAQAQAEMTEASAEVAEEAAADVAPRRRGFARLWYGE